MGILGKKLRKLANNKSEKEGRVAEKKKVSVPKTNMDAVRSMRRKLKKVGGGSDNKWWKPAEGGNLIRILPSNVPAHADIPAGGFSFNSCLHYGFRDDKRNRAYPCLDHIGTPPCPVCQFIARYSNETDPDVVKLLRNIRPSHQYMMNIIDRNGKIPRVQIWSAPPGLTKDIVRFMSDPDYGDITDVDEGFDLKLERENNKGRTSYNVIPRPRPSEIGLENWQEQLFDLQKEAYTEIPTYSQYVAMMKDQFADLGFDFDFLTVGKKKKKSKPAPEKEEEIDEEELDSEDDTDEDEEGDD